MRSFLILLFAAALAGCASPESEGPASTAPDSVPASQAVYSCESGRTVQASYPTDNTAVVEYEGQTLQMEVAVSGSGARYVGDELEWWTKGTGPGSEGTLFRHNSDGTSGEMVEQCEQPS